MRNTAVETEQFFHRTLHKLNITQAELAKRVGISPAEISRYKLGKQKPRIEFIEKMALAMELDVISLMIGLGVVDPEVITMPEVPLHNWRRA